MGVVGRVDGASLALGNAALMERVGASVAGLASEADAHRARGATVVYLARDGVLRGALTIVDPVKESTPAALDALRRLGIRIHMATGDAEGTARAVAEDLGIHDVAAGLSPADKLALIETLQAEGRTVAMAGDGINDSPALAKADVGIAMGTGTDVAMESADVTLVRGELDAIVRARRLSEVTLRNIRQNLVFAFGYNALGIPIAAGALYWLTGGLLSPMIAAAAMSLSSVSVIGNALRLRAVDLDG